ncbi:MAG: alpha/beta hydrolase [Ignavibacteriales bacterium]|nr:alpha/beta hydrolase [Ignavibacteriales bacterium]
MAPRSDISDQLKIQMLLKEMVLTRILERTLRFGMVLMLLMVCGSTFLHSEFESITVDGATLYYRTFGKGTPILLVGGIAGASNEYLLPIAQELRKTHRIILVDLRGTGKSVVEAVDSSTINLNRVLNDLEALRLALRIRKWIVFGHSFGGTISMGYASRFPAETQALVLVGSGGFDPSYLDYYSPNILARLTNDDSLKLREAESLLSIDKEIAKTEEFRIKLGAQVWDRNHLPEIRRWFNRETYSPVIAQAMWTSFLTTPFALIESLRKFHKPVLLIQGEVDPVDKRTAMQIQNILKQARQEFVKNSGHFPWVEQKEKFYIIIKKFLKTIR